MDSIVAIQLLESVALYQSCVMLSANSLADIAVNSWYIPKKQRRPYIIHALSSFHCSQPPPGSHGCNDIWIQYDGVLIPSKILIVVL